MIKRSNQKNFCSGSKKHLKKLIRQKSLKKIDPKAYLGPGQTLMMKLFAKIINEFQLLTNFAKILNHRYLTGS